MMTILKTAACTLAIALVALVALPASAQKHGHGKGYRKEMMEQKFTEFSTRLNLTADQQAKVKQIMKDGHAEMKQIREEKKDGQKEAKREAMKSLKNRLDERITAVLDDKQREAYKKYKDEKRAERKAKMKSRKMQDPSHEQLEMDDDGLL